MIKKDFSMKINPEHPYDYGDTPTYKRQGSIHLWEGQDDSLTLPERRRGMTANLQNNALLSQV